MSADDILNKSLRALYIQAEQKDPLDVLGLKRRGATAAQAKASYRALALRLHPDKCKSEKTKDLHTRLFQLVSAAYELVIAATPVDNKDPSVATGDDDQVKLEDLRYAEKLRRQRTKKLQAEQARKADLEEKRLRQEAKDARLAKLEAYKAQVWKNKHERTKLRGAVARRYMYRTHRGEEPPGKKEFIAMLDQLYAEKDWRQEMDEADTHPDLDKTDALRYYSDKAREEYFAQRRFPAIAAGPHVQAKAIESGDEKDFSSTRQPNISPIKDYRKPFCKKYEDDAEAAAAFKSEKLTASRRHRGGQILLDHDDDFDEPLADRDAYLLDNYEAQLLSGRPTNISLRDYEYKKHIKARLDTVNSKLWLIDDYQKHMEAHMYVGYSGSYDRDHHHTLIDQQAAFMHKLAEVEERPLPNVDRDIWDDRVKYVFDASQGHSSQALLNPAWVHAQNAKNPSTIEYSNCCAAIEGGKDSTEATETPVAEVTSGQFSASPETVDLGASKTADDTNESSHETVTFPALPPAAKPLEGTPERSVMTSIKDEGSTKATADALRRQKQREIANVLRNLPAYKENNFLLRHWVKKISGESKVDID